ncbi:MAG: hypothetical protein CVT90_02340 [Candidatus Altiarchaeales archaeon HGW-Altiarchaeales-3]|nr:MAG: hypothetical protein CVT90_02340 [Candidatus Altiarchaeales archaeon HGW-Altiarchaeales-3]
MGQKLEFKLIYASDLFDTQYFFSYKLEMNTKPLSIGKSLVIITILIVVLGDVNAYSDDGDGNCTCSNCTDCTIALNSNDCNIVKLTNKITTTSHCINNPENFTNKTFDCQGYEINGSGGTYSGVYLYEKSRSIIRNCTIVNFYRGIYLRGSANNSLINNTVSSNDYGIYLLITSNSRLINNKVSSNDYGFFLQVTSNNTLINNAVSSNNRGIHLTLSSLNNTLINNTINSNDYGISLTGSRNDSIINNTISSNDYGIYLVCSHFDNILNNKILNNTQTGLVITDQGLGWSCSMGNLNNTIRENKISNNRDGIYSQNSISVINSNIICGNTNKDLNSSDWKVSFGDNNTCDNSGGWEDHGIESSCTFRCNGTTCDVDNDFYTKELCAGTDCEDLNSFINPATAEICDDSIDNDCDNLTDCLDPNCSGSHVCVNTTSNETNEINNTQVNIIDPPLGEPICINQTTSITVKITINATNPGDSGLGNVSAGINVTCTGNYISNEKQYVNLSETLSANLTFIVTPPASGQCNVTTCIDCEGSINETNENDNCGSLIFSVVDCSKVSVPALSQTGILILSALAIVFCVLRIKKKQINE